MSQDLDEFLRNRYPDTFELTDEELDRRLNEALLTQGVVGAADEINLTNNNPEFIDIVNFLQSDAINDMPIQDFLLELDRLNRVNDMRREMILQEEMERLRHEHEQMMVDHEDLILLMQTDRQELRERIRQLEENSMILNRILEDNPNILSKYNMDNYDMSF